VFLVLNDVWKEGGLEQLELANGQGSVTLVTAKNQHVLKKSRIIDEGKVNINVLLVEDSWRLFCVLVFPKGLLNIPLDELQQVATMVVNECKGLSLALKVISGSHMLPQHKLLKEENKLFG
jgi:hypothetical protein